MRWWLVAVPLLLEAQTIRVLLPDTMPAALRQWAQVRGELVIISNIPRAVRIRLWLEPAQSPVVSVPFAALPVTILRDTLRLPINALIAELIASSQPFFRHNRLGGGNARLCVELCDVNDSTQRIGKQICRSFVVKGMPAIEIVEPNGTVALRDTATLYFRWRVRRASLEQVLLRLRVAPYRYGQTHWYALMVNPPLWTCEQLSDGRTEWECAMPATILSRGSRYVWGVFAVEPDGSEELVSPVGQIQVK